MHRFFRKCCSYKFLFGTVLFIGLLPLLGQVTFISGAVAYAQDATPKGNQGTPKGDQTSQAPSGTSSAGNANCPMSPPPPTWAYYPSDGATGWSTGTYSPSRLSPQGSSVCVAASGKVVYVEKPEADGDIDYYMVLDDPYKYLAGSNKQINIVRTFSGISRDCKRTCEMIWEDMPRDGGHLPELQAGDQVTVTGAWVTDTWHGHNEMHPIFVQNGASSGPQYGGSPASSSNPYRDCRDENNNQCVGYYQV